jgi:DNA-binding CsgD family transcriptional regulator
VADGAGDELAGSVVSQRTRGRREHLGRTLDSASLASPTEREREVLTLVAAGMSNDEIAAALYMSPLTAKTHVSRTMTTLNARDPAQLVVAADETGLVTPGAGGRHLQHDANSSHTGVRGGSGKHVESEVRTPELEGRNIRDIERAALRTTSPRRSGQQRCRTAGRGRLG